MNDFYLASINSYVEKKKLDLFFINFFELTDTEELKTLKLQGACLFDRRDEVDGLA